MEWPFRSSGTGIPFKHNLQKECIRDISFIKTTDSQKVKILLNKAFMDILEDTDNKIYFGKEIVNV